MKTSREWWFHNEEQSIIYGEFDGDCDVCDDDVSYSFSSFE